MLDWFDDPEQRRRTGTILNKGEAQNVLARAIFLNRLGELRDRTFENQRHRDSGLILLIAAVTLWNTVYLDLAVRHLCASGAEMPRCRTNCSPVSRRCDGSTSASPAIICEARRTNLVNSSALSAFIRTVGMFSLRFRTSSHRFPCPYT